MLEKNISQQLKWTFSYNVEMLTLISVASMKLANISSCLGNFGEVHADIFLLFLCQSESWVRGRFAVLFV